MSRTRDQQLLDVAPAAKWTGSKAPVPDLLAAARHLLALAPKSAVIRRDGLRIHSWTEGGFNEYSHRWPMPSKQSRTDEGSFLPTTPTEINHQRATVRTIRRLAWRIHPRHNHWHQTTHITRTDGHVRITTTWRHP